MRHAGCFAGSMLPLVATLALFVMSSGASAQSLSQAITNLSSATITYMGYNETGFMNTSEGSHTTQAITHVVVAALKRATHVAVADGLLSLPT